MRFISGNGFVGLILFFVGIGLVSGGIAARGENADTSTVGRVTASHPDAQLAEKNGTQLAIDELQTKLSEIELQVKQNVSGALDLRDQVLAKLQAAIEDRLSEIDKRMGELSSKIQQSNSDIKVLLQKIKSNPDPKADGDNQNAIARQLRDLTSERDRLLPEKRNLAVRLAALETRDQKNSNSEKEGGGRSPSDGVSGTNQPVESTEKSQ